MRLRWTHRHLAAPVRTATTPRQRCGTVPSQWMGCAHVVTAPHVLLHRFIRVRNITDANVTEMHSEILSVFDGTDIITPDQLRGNASTLREALIDKGGRCVRDRTGHCAALHLRLQLDAHFS